MRSFYLIALLLSTSFVSGQKMVTAKIGEEITLKIPAEFVSMSNQDRMNKIASSKVPLAQYSSLEQDVTLGVNDNFMQWTKDDTQTVYGFYKASVQALFDDIEFIQDTVKTINGREFIVFEFTSVVKSSNTFSSGKSSRNYTYIQYTSYNDQVLLFNFGCPARLKYDWEGIAEEIMSSVKIK